MSEAKASDEHNLRPEQYEFLNKMFKKTRAAGKKIGLPDKFLDDLTDEANEDDNDWSFVIKVHALMETALTHMLSERLQISGQSASSKKEELSNFISRLPMNGRNGKISFANSVGLMNKDIQNFLEKLSEIRNFYVHDLRNINVSLEEYIFKAKREAEFFKAFIPWYPEDADPLPKSAFKLYILLALCVYLSVIENFSSWPASLLSLLGQDEELAAI